MPNLILYKNSDNSIAHFWQDAVIVRKNFVTSLGRKSACKLLSPNPNYSIMWIDDADIPTPVYSSGSSNEIIGYEELATDFTPITEGIDLTQTKYSDRILYKKAIAAKRELAELDFDQLDTYIEKNIFDLASAKVYLKKLSKVVLGIIKFSDYQQG